MKPANLTVVTLNVHLFKDSSWKDNFQQTIDFLRSINADIVILCEVATEKIFKTTNRKNGQICNIEYLSSAISLRHTTLQKNESFSCGSTILSRFPILSYTPIYPVDEFSKSRVIPSYRMQRAIIDVGEGEHLEVLGLHLNYRLETTRHAQVDAVQQMLNKQAQIPRARIWAGDFNALTREDYSVVEWKRIATVRKQNRWEVPQTSLTARLKNEFDLTDCWEATGHRGSVSTCRFHTRIDYVMVNKEFLKRWSITNCEIKETPFTDHNAVVATFASRTSN